MTDFVGVDTHPGQVCGPSYTAGEHAPFGDVSRTTAVMSWLFKKKKVRTQTLPAWLSVRVWVEGEGSRGCVGQNACMTVAVARDV